MTNTSTYHLAQYLDSIIKPLIPNKYMVNSTNNFIDKVHKVKFSNSDFIVSFDVESFFTIVPLHETIDLICNYVYDNNSGDTPAFPKNSFKKLLTISVEGIFMYD